MKDRVNAGSARGESSTPKYAGKSDILGPGSSIIEGIPGVSNTMTPNSQPFARAAVPASQTGKPTQGSFLLVRPCQFLMPAASDGPNSRHGQRQKVSIN